MAKADYQEIIAEYKEQVRVLKEQVNELTDACKAKDSALKNEEKQLINIKILNTENLWVVQDLCLCVIRSELKLKF